jgi:hypothetical protein
LSETEDDVTEEDARKKWCPFTRVVKGQMNQVPMGQPAFNRIDNGPGMIGASDASGCIASACMAWTGTGCGLVPRCEPMTDDEIEF